MCVCWDRKSTALWDYMGSNCFKLCASKSLQPSSKPPDLPAIPCSLGDLNPDLGAQGKRSQDLRAGKNQNKVWRQITKHASHLRLQTCLHWIKPFEDVQMLFYSGTWLRKNTFSMRRIFKGIEMQRPVYFGFQKYPGFKSSEIFICWTCSYFEER